LPRKEELMMNKVIFSTVMVGVVSAAALGVVATSGAPAVERIDFGEVVTATEPVFDARVYPATSATVREFRIPMTHRRSRSRRA
jgi:hypothetical protein